MSTYLQLVNDTLARLRETSVASVTTNAYSTLVGKFVNDAKRQVEDAFNWDSMAVTITLNTAANTSNYVVTGSGLKPRDLTLNNTTNKNTLKNVPLQWIIDQQQLSTTQTGSPCYYAWNGNNGTDSKVELYPTPNAAEVLKFNMYVPQLALSADADILLIPSEPVVFGAYARALVERGEDGGLTSSEAYGLFKGSLSDHVANESTRFIENDSWVAI